MRQTCKRGYRMSRVRFYSYKAEAAGRTPDLMGGNVHVLKPGNEWKVQSLIRERSKAAAERHFRASHKEYRRYCRQSKVNPRTYANVTMTRTTKSQRLS